MPLKACINPETSKSLGLIAGMGDLPMAVAAEAKKKGYKVVAIALQPSADESLRPVADDFHKISIARLGGLINLLKKLTINEAVMAGKVPKSLLYKNKKDLIPDLKMIRLFFSLKNRADDTIMNAIVAELEENGIKLHKTTAFTEELLAPEGVITRRKPTKNDLRDIEFGLTAAKEIGRMDIGQTVIVKSMAVMAVEAIEGTDEAIKRGGKLARKDAVVVKVSKPQQDMRFDVPVVGLDTIRSMKKSDSRVLAVESGKCIIVDRDKFIKEANNAGIVVVGVK
jgi:DUF1009 family protein